MDASAQPHTEWRELTASNRLVIELVKAVEGAGVSRAAFLEAARVDPAWLDATEARVQLGAVFDACEVAVDLTGDEAFGLHWGERLTANAFNVVSHLLTHASNLYEAFQTLSRFGELVSDRLGLELVEEDAYAMVRTLDTRGWPLVIRRVMAETTTLGLFRLVQQLGGPDVPLHRVCFQYPAPAHRAEYTRVFGGAERFDQRFTGLVFRRDLLRAPSLQKDEDLYATLAHVAERRLVRLRGRTPYSVHLRDFLMQQRSPHKVAMPRAARRLGLSVRSLHRRLTEEGASYASLANEAAADVAKRLLLEERHTIKETAYAMGFSNVSSFHRAFRRWTGTTPSAFRAGH